MVVNVGTPWKIRPQALIIEVGFGRPWQSKHPAAASGHTWNTAGLFSHASAPSRKFNDLLAREKEPPDSPGFRCPGLPRARWYEL